MGHRDQPLGEAKIKQGIQNKYMLFDDENTSNTFDSFDVETQDLLDGET